MAEGGRETGQLSVSDTESTDSDLGETMESAEPSKVLTLEDPDSGNDVRAMAAPSRQPRSGEVLDTEQRQMVPCPNSSLDQKPPEKGDNTQTASGKVDMKVEGNSGVVKGIEQHVYQGCTFYKYEILASSPGDLPALTQGAASPFLQMSPSVDLPGLPPPSVSSLPPPSVPSLPPPSVPSLPPPSVPSLPSPSFPSLPPPSFPSLPPPSVPSLPPPSVPSLPPPSVPSLPALPLPPPPVPLPQVTPTTELQPSSSVQSQQLSSQQQSSQQQSSQQQSSQQQSSQQQSSQQQSSQQQSSQQQSSQQQSSQQQSSQQQSSQQQSSQQQPPPPTFSPPPPQAASMARGEGGAPGRQSTESQTAAPPSPPPSVPFAAPPHLPEESKKLKNLIAITEQYMATACPQGYVETLALGELEEELEDSGVCLVLGLPGHGKTALALQAMGRLAASHQFKPVRLRKPEQWDLLPGENEEHRGVGTRPLQESQSEEADLLEATDKISEPSGNAFQSQSQGPSQKKEVQDSRRYVVLLDDVFGKGHYDAAKKKAWEEVFDLVRAKVRAKQVKVILVSPIHIYEECKKSLGGYQLFDDVKTIDLTKSEYWTDSDRQAILENFLQEKHVHVDTPIENFIWASRNCTQIGFPQACRFFASEEKAQLQGPDFFHKPLQFLHKQFEEMQENDIRSYLVLILTWLEGGILSSKFLSNKHKAKERISDLCEQFDVKDMMTIREVKTKARSLCSVYLSKDEEGNFQFIHQSICDSLVVAMCSFDLERALDVCSIQQVCGYVRTKDSVVDQSGLTYTVPKSEWPLLAARLVKAMTSEELLQALCHPSLRNKEFVSVLVTKHLTAPTVSQVLQRDCCVETDLSTQLPSCRVSCESNSKYVMFDVRTGIFSHLPYASMATSSVISALMLKQLIELARHFLATEFLKGLPKADVSTHLREALATACYVCNGALVTDLLKTDAEVTPDTVRAACESREDDVNILRKVTKKLSREKLDVSLCTDFLWVCCVKSKVGSLKYLLSEARIPKFQDSVDQVLTELVRESHPANRSKHSRHHFRRLSELLTHLKDAGGRLDTTKVDLWHAASHPSAFALKEHFDGDKSQLFIFSLQDESTLLHEAARHGSLECLEELTDPPVKKGIDINALDEANQTPLCLAVEGNHIGAMEILLSRGADPNIGTVRVKKDFHPKFRRAGTVLTKRTCAPLLAAAARHCASAVNLLLQYKASTDVTDDRMRTPLHLYAAGTRGNATDDLHKEVEQCSEKDKPEELLIETSPDINQKDSDGATPLHLACTSGQTSLVQKLLSNNARVDLVDKRGRTVLHALADGAEYRKGKRDANTVLKTIVETYQSQQASMGREAGERVGASMRDLVNSTDKEGRAPLHLAAARGDLNLVKALLQHNADTEIQNRQGCTPLHVAASYCHYDVMDALIAKQARMDAEDVQGCTPLHLYGARLQTVKSACHSQSKPEQVAIKKTFLRRDAVLREKLQNKRNACRQTPLHLAAKRGFHSFTQILLEADAERDVMDRYNRLPLHWMAAVRREEKAWWHMKKADTDKYKKLRIKTEKLFVSTTPDVNVQDKNKKTPLHLAAETGSLSLIKCLLEQGANPDIKDENLRLPLHLLSARRGLAYRDKDTLTEAEVLLVKKTKNINLRDKEGKTPLHLALEQQNLPVLVTLLNYGANPDIKDEKQQTVLQILARTRLDNSEVENLLIEKSADINARDADGKTVLHVAAENNNLSVVKCLLKQDANADMPQWSTHDPHVDVNIQDKNEKTPLHLSIENDDLDIALELLNHGARTDLVDNDQRLPLHSLVRRKKTAGWDENLHARVLALLVDKAANVTARDKNGKTALHLAAELGKKCFLQSLLQLGVMRGDSFEQEQSTSQKRTTFHTTVMENHGETRTRETVALTGKNTFLEVQDGQGKTVLHLTVQYRRWRLMEILMEHGAGTDIVDGNGRLPLHVMASLENGDIPIKAQTLLVDRTADINVQDKDGRTPFHLATEKGKASLMAALLLKESGPADVEGRMPLMFLAIESWLKTLEDDEMTQRAMSLITENAADINVQDKSGKTLLHFVIGGRNWPLARLLLQQGARADLTDDAGRCPLHCLAAELPERRKREQSWKELQTLLLEKTPDINCQDDKNQTFLHLAASTGNFEMVILLLEHDANADLQNKYKQLPLHLMDPDNCKSEAAVWDLAVERLVQKTSDINIRDHTGATPLHLAASRGFVRLATALLKLGARMDLTDGPPCLPLHIQPVDRTPCLNVQDSEGQTPLHHAAKHSNVSLAVSLLEHGANANIKDNQERLPMHWMSDPSVHSYRGKACEYDAATKLVEMTDDIDAPDESGKTPLQLAVERDNIPMMFALLKRDLRTDLVDIRGRILLHIFAEQSKGSKYNPHAVTEKQRQTEALLVQKTADVNVQEKAGKTALHLAVERGNFSLATLLLNNDAKADVQDKEKRLPLHSMAMEAYPKKNEGTDLQRAETLLVDKTADISVQDARGRTPLHLAIERGNNSLSCLLLKRKARTDLSDENNHLPLHLMALHTRWWNEEDTDKSDTKNHLVEKTADVNVQDKTGKTPLHLAVDNDNYSLAVLLLNAGAKTNLLDNSENLPLHLLISKADRCHRDRIMYDACSLLVEKSTDIDVQDKSGKTPLHLVIEKGNFSLTVCLLNRGARTDLQDSNRRLPLHVMALLGRWQNSRHWNVRQLEALLVAKTADKNARDSTGKTPLHLALECGNHSLAVSLLKGGAKTDLVDNDKRLPLHSMALHTTANNDEERNNVKAQNLVLDKTADINVQDKAGKTPLHLAIEKGNFPLVAVLLHREARTDLDDKDGHLPLHTMALTACWREERVMVEQEGEKEKEAEEKTAEEKEEKEEEDYVDKERDDEEDEQRQKRQARSLLVEKTENTSLPDKLGKTPLDLATESGNHALERILWDSGRF